MILTEEEREVLRKVARSSHNPNSIDSTYYVSDSICPDLKVRVWYNHHVSIHVYDEEVSSKIDGPWWDAIRTYCSRMSEYIKEREESYEETKRREEIEKHARLASRFEQSKRPWWKFW